ncbi:MAG: bifunctional hydroxymethylpyrimidine kinase/phosphomethylpyrimidine kinase [Terriglobales bacterium]
MASISTAPPLVLTIAGFDPTGGAGILADIKTIAANQAYGLACVAAITVQNTQGAQSYQPVAPELLEAQLEGLLTELAPRAVKIGMIGSAGGVEVVARALERHPVPWVVLDPVRKASSGAALMDERGWEALRKRLLPKVDVLTPNIDETEVLTGIRPGKPAEFEQAAIKLREMGPQYVVIKGGHLERPCDWLYDGEKFVTLAADRVRTANTHGTGCTLSAALAANLANGKQVQDAVVMAKAYLTAALKQAYAIGPGPGPVNHLYRLQESPASRNVDPAPQTTFTTR